MTPGVRISKRDPVKLGTEPIVYMQELMRDGRLSNELVEGGTGGGQDGRLMICCFFTCNAVQERERERERCNKLWLSFLGNCYYGRIHR